MLLESNDNYSLTLRAADIRAALPPNLVNELEQEDREAKLRRRGLGKAVREQLLSKLHEDWRLLLNDKRDANSLEGNLPLAERTKRERAFVDAALHLVPIYAALSAVDQLARYGEPRPSVPYEKAVQAALNAWDKGKFEDALNALADIPEGDLTAAHFPKYFHYERRRSGSIRTGTEDQRAKALERHPRKNYLAVFQRDRWIWLVCFALIMLIVVSTILIVRWMTPKPFLPTATAIVVVPSTHLFETAIVPSPTPHELRVNSVKPQDDAVIQANGKPFVLVLEGERLDLVNKAELRLPDSDQAGEPKVITLTVELGSGVVRRNLVGTAPDNINRADSHYEIIINDQPTNLFVTITSLLGSPLDGIDERNTHFVPTDVLGRDDQGFYAFLRQSPERDSKPVRDNQGNPVLLRKTIRIIVQGSPTESDAWLPVDVLDPEEKPIATGWIERWMISPNQIVPTDTPTATPRPKPTATPRPKPTATPPPAETPAPSPTEPPTLTPAETPAPSPTDRLILPPGVPPPPDNEPPPEVSVSFGASHQNHATESYEHVDVQS